MQPCAERDKLRKIAEESLDDIINFGERLRNAIRSDSLSGTLSPLDQDLEKAVGSKERAFGALAQHCKEHGCER